MTYCGPRDNPEWSSFILESIVLINGIVQNQLPQANSPYHGVKSQFLQ